MTEDRPTKRNESNFFKSAIIIDEVHIVSVNEAFQDTSHPIGRMMHLFNAGFLSASPFYTMKIVRLVDLSSTFRYNVDEKDKRWTITHEKF